LSERAFGADEAIQLLDDAVHRRKTEAGAFAEIFGGEEGLEHASHGLVIHAETGVADGQQHVRRASTRRRPEVDLHAGRRDRQRPAVRHRVARVDHEIHDDLFDLARVRQDYRGRRASVPR
jgi:hypothetical protein